MDFKLLHEAPNEIPLAILETWIKKANETYFNGTLEYMNDHYYDRQSILKWVRSKGTDPLTREPLQESDLLLRSEFLKDYAYEMSELSQALTVFGAMIIAIALAIPIPIAVSIGTVIGYFMLDLDFAGIANSMYTGVEPFPLITVPLFCLIQSTSFLKRQSQFSYLLVTPYHKHA